MAAEPLGVGQVSDEDGGPIGSVMWERDEDGSLTAHVRLGA